jgi:hypothetical protein
MNTTSMKGKGLCLHFDGRQVEQIEDVVLNNGPMTKFLL